MMNITASNNFECLINLANLFGLLAIPRAAYSAVDTKTNPIRSEIIRVHNFSVQFHNAFIHSVNINDQTFRGIPMITIDTNFGASGKLWDININLDCIIEDLSRLAQYFHGPIGVTFPILRVYQRMS
jgi:hypothetical protein